MEELDNVLKILKNAEKAFFDLEKVELNIKNDEIQVLNSVFHRMKPIMRFIDSKIVMCDDTWLSRNGWKGREALSHKKYVLLKKQINDYSPSDSRYTYKRKGFHIYLSREGEIVKFDRSGYYDQFQNMPQLLEMTNKELLTVSQLLDYMGFKEIINSLLLTINQAIEENANKRPQLKNRLNTLKTIQRFLEEEK